MLSMMSGSGREVSLGGCSGRVRKDLVRWTALWVALVAPAVAQSSSGVSVDPLERTGPVSMTRFEGGPGELPPTLDPSRLQGNLEEAPEIRSTPQESVPLKRETLTPDNADQVTFVYREMRIEGATEFSDDQLLQAWTLTDGETASVADIFRFANAITSMYAEAGYALSFAVVPEQDVENGIVNIRVVEGFIDKIEFSEAKSDKFSAKVSRHRAEAILSRLVGSGPLKTADLERCVLLVNDLPGLKVGTTLAPSTTPGGAILAVEIRDIKPLSASVDYNNYLPDSFNRDSGGVTASVSGVLTGSDQFSISGWKSFTQDAYWSASGEGSIGIGNNGLRVGASYGYSNSEPDDAFLTALEYLGETKRGRAWMRFPLIRSRTQNLTLEGALIANNSRSEILADTLVDDRLRSAEVSLAYDFAGSARAINYIRVGAERGMDIFGAQGNSRANGQLEYTNINLDLQRTQPLWDVFSGSVSMQVGLRGQAMFGPGGLFSGSECAYGGRRFGRAYDSGVLSGEQCALGFGEMRWDGRVGPIQAQFYGYGDGGYLWQKGQLEAGQLRERSGASAGLGMRLHVTDSLSAAVEGGWALGSPTGVVLDEDFKLNASLSKRF